MACSLASGRGAQCALLKRKKPTPMHLSHSPARPLFFVPSTHATRELARNIAHGVAKCGLQ